MPRNKAASARQRLLDLSRKTGEDFQLLLTRYAVERLLSRLSRSAHANRFLLKGAMLFALWTGRMHRPTRDLDLLGFGDSSEAALLSVFRELCAIADEDDGLEFKADTVTVEPIREDQEYGGQRVLLRVQLGNARVDLQIDVGFGDAVTPAAEVVTYPTLLGMAAPELRAYPRETVVAEKLQAMVLLGMANSRMKDFFDLWVMARDFPFTGEPLCRAVAATFSRRKTDLPGALPLALTDAFAKDETKKTQWNAFRTRSGLKAEVGELEDVVAALARFLGPVLGAADRGEECSLHWPAGGPGLEGALSPLLTVLPRPSSDTLARWRQSTWPTKCRRRLQFPPRSRLRASGAHRQPAVRQHRHHPRAVHEPEVPQHGRGLLARARPRASPHSPRKAYVATGLIFAGYFIELRDEIEPLEASLVCSTGTLRVSPAR